MATIFTRSSKGSALTHNEIDANFTNLNDDFISLNDDKAEKSNVLTKDNTTAFTPDNDYEPATKKYVDDNSGLSIASTAEAQAWVNDITAISPLKLDEAFQGANQSIGSSSFYQKLPGGLIIQGGIVSPGTSGQVTITLPVSFTVGVYVAIAGWSRTSSSGVDGSAPVIRVVNNSQIQVYRSTSLSDNWIVIGK